MSGLYESVPLVHTDVTLDVRGLAAAATVTQQYVNSGTEPIEAVYVFPLPHDAAVYDMEIRIGNRLIRSVIREREEAKRVYESAKSEGKRAALVEEERPNICTASVATLMPGDHIDVRLRYVQPLSWEDGRIRLVFPMVVGPRYIPGTQAVSHTGTGWAVDTDAVSDASRITPPVRNPDSRPGHDISLFVDLDSGFEFGSINSVSHAITVRRLPDGRRGIVGLNHILHEFASEPLTATSENIAAARRFVRNLEAGGGTEMLPALLHVMRKSETPGYLRHIVLLTDGDLGNEEQIFDALRGNLGGARLYTVAIGSSPNFFLATKMAQFGRGTFTHIADIGEIREQMGRLLGTIESPVLTDVKLTFEGVEVAEVYPQRTPDLFLRQPLVLYGRITRGHTGRVHLTARAGHQPYEASFAFDASTATFHPGITTLWARQRVEDLVDRWRVSDEDSRAEIRSTLIAHAIRYRLVTRFT